MSAIHNMNIEIAKYFFIRKFGLYTLLLLMFAFNLSSHTFAYWPGDSWWLRSIYWMTYLSLALGLLFGVFYVLERILYRCSAQLLFALAILISWIPFGLAITMVDIATARPEISYVISDLHKTGFIPTLLPVMVMIILPKHLVFGGLIYLLHFYVQVGVSRSQVGKPTLANDSEPEDNNELLHVGFIDKLTPQVRSNPLLLQAQEHYVDVTTELGHELILYKFGQAIREIPKDYGLQVHRSFWVAKQNIKGWSATDASIRVFLHYGESAPVSRRFEYYIKQNFPELH